MTYAARITLFALLLLAPRMPVECDEPAEPRPTAALIERWLAAPPAERPPVEAELRRRGTQVLGALLAASAKAKVETRERLQRLAARIREDWYRKKVPAGMAYVPPGPVEVPRDKAPWGPAGRRVQVKGFYIDKTEVVVDAWRKWLAHLREHGESKSRLWSLWQPPSDMDGNMPVVRVRLADVVRFAREWRKGRLPTAEEFERAMRGSGVATYPWGDEMRAGHANLRGHGPGRPLPVGKHPPGASVFGVHDLVGNVAEWSATTVKQGSRGRYPLVLGGSYLDAPGPALTWRGLDRMAARVSPHESRAWLGFRVVRDLPALP